MWKPSMLATAGCIAVVLGTLTAGTIYVWAMLFFWFWLPVVLLQYVLWFVLAKMALNRGVVRPTSTVVAIAAAIVFTPISANTPYWLAAMHMEATTDDTPLPPQAEIVEIVANPVVNLDMGSTVTFRLRPEGDVLNLLRDYVLALENRGWEKWRGEVPTETGRFVLLNFSDRSGSQIYGHLEVTAAWNSASGAYDFIQVRRSQSSSLPEVMLIFIAALGLVSTVLVASKK